MRTATREETRFIQRIIMFFVFPLIVCIAATFYLSGRAENVQEDIDDIEKTLSRSLKKYGTLPTLKRVTQEKSTLEQMQQNYGTLQGFATVRPINPPEDVIERGVYFKKQLFLAHKGIKELARKKDIDIPSTIGFGEALPSDSEVSVLLRKLETVSSVLKVLISKNVKNITVVKMLDDVQHATSDGKVLPAREVAVRIDTNCSQGSIVQILNEVGNMKPFLVVRDISIKNFKEGMLEASFVFSRLIAEG